MYSDCFVSTDDNQTVRSFVRTASKSNPHLQWAKISDKLWSLYVLNMAKEYQNSGSYKQKTLVSRVGAITRHTDRSSRETHSTKQTKVFLVGLLKTLNYSWVLISFLASKRILCSIGVVQGPLI